MGWSLRRCRGNSTYPAEHAQHKHVPSFMFCCKFSQFARVSFRGLWQTRTFSSSTVGLQVNPRQFFLYRGTIKKNLYLCVLDDVSWFAHLDQKMEDHAEWSFNRISRRNRIYILNLYRVGSRLLVGQKAHASAPLNVSNSCQLHQCKICHAEHGSVDFAITYGKSLQFIKL